MILTILLIGCLCVGLLRYWWKFCRVKNVRVFPNYVPVLGHCLSLKNNDSFKWMVKEVGEYSLDCGGIAALFIGPVPVYVISDPVQATVVLSTCLEKAFVYKLINPLFGDTLVSASVPVWKRNRRVLDLAFKPLVLDGYMGVFNAQASRLLEMIDEKAGKGWIDLTDEITRNILETTCQTTMGKLPKDEVYVNKRYVQALHKVFEIVTLRIMKVWLFFDCVFYFSSLRKELKESLEVIHETSTKMVALRKLEYLERVKCNEVLTNKDDNIISYLDIVIQNSMTDEGSLFTDLQLRYLCDNILLAAFDTTMYELLFTLVCIGSDEKVQQKIYQEIVQVLGEEENVRKEHLRKLTYLEASIKEAIRLYPVGPIVGRQTTAEVQLGDVTLPPSSLIAVHLWAINRNRKYWGPDADEFNPDRWFDVKTLPEHPNAFGSFAFGKRNCIGKLYALMHMKTTLVPLLRKYRIKSDHKKMELSAYAMLKVKSGHLIKLELR